MKKRWPQQNQEGAALLTVMAVLLLVAFSGAAVLGVASYQVYSVDGMRDTIKARALAEAGANHAYSVLKEDFEARNDPSAFPETSMGGGTYDATVTSIGDNLASVSSIGKYNGAKVEVLVDVKNFADLTPGTDPTDPFSYGIFVDDELTHNGSSTVLGALHCNNKVVLNGKATWGAPFEGQAVTSWKVGSGGKNTYIDGIVRSPSISGAAQIATPVIQAVDIIPFPEVNLTEYYNIAVAHSQVYGGGYVDGNFGAIPGGVRWHNGDITIGDVDYEGVLIATGSITVQGSVDQEQVGALPALISRDSFIRFNGARDLTGLLYCPDYLRFNGAGTLTGCAMTGDDLTFNGNSGVFTYMYSAPGGPGDDPTSPADQVGITAWQK